MTNLEILNAIRACARKLGRVPTLRELKQMAGVTQRKVTGRFGTLGEAIRAAGLEPIGPGHVVKREALLKDWAELARKLKRLPTKAEYDAKGRYSVAPINRLWRWWRDVAEDFRVFARKQNIEDDWKDVLKLIDAQYPLRDAEKGPAPRESAKKPEDVAGTSADASAERKPVRIQVKRKLPGRPVYGERISLPGLSRAPMNEDGVLLLFGMLAHRLGFDILKVQQEFPDCEAMREVGPGKWQLTLIEFEFESRSFAQHRHDPRGCDIIVCWRHNWPACPSRIEVIELRKEVERLRNRNCQNCQDCQK